MMHAPHEACICLLIWEYWLGVQNWIKAHSSIEVLLLLFGLIFGVIVAILTVIYWAIIARFKKEK